MSGCTSIMMTKIEHIAWRRRSTASHYWFTLRVSMIVVVVVGGNVTDEAGDNDGTTNYHVSRHQAVLRRVLSQFNSHYCECEKEFDPRLVRPKPRWLRSNYKYCGSAPVDHTNDSLVTASCHQAINSCEQQVVDQQSQLDHRLDCVGKICFIVRNSLIKLRLNCE